jgi:glutamate--cysteine ligase
LARDSIDTTPIENRSQLIEWMEKGCKPVEAFRIGTEHEKFAFYKDSLQPVPYDGPKGIKALLEGMAELLAWEPILDDNRIIGLTEPLEQGAISLEPGGQFELSGAPLETLHQTCKEVHGHLAQLREVADPLNIGFLGLGMAPTWRLEDIPRMPKSRYDVMKRYMPKVGNDGIDMMFRTATIQVNLDFSSERDMVDKMRVGLNLQPLATALFANSPFTDGKPNGILSRRAALWGDVDPHRTGMLPFVFDEGFGFESYVDWAMNVPMYFVKRGDTYHDVAGSSFHDLLNGTLEALPGERATLSDWTNHLSTLFPDVRLKRFIEMRGADGGPWRRICALPAFWVGLLYDQTSLNAAFDLTRDWTEAEREHMRRNVPVYGLHTPFRDGILQDIAKEIVAISSDGLKRRGHLNSDMEDETIFLNAVEETVTSGRTPAQEMLERYNNGWQQDLNAVFKEYAY